MQGGDVLHRHARRLQREHMLEAAAQALLGVGPGDGFDARAAAPSAGNAHGGVLDLGDVFDPREVPPASRREALVDAVGDGPAARAPRRPGARHLEVDLGAGRGEPLDVPDASASLVLVPDVVDLPSPYLLLKLRFMVANPIRKEDGIKRFLALGLQPPPAKAAA
jgi:hypothetical protein